MWIEIRNKYLSICCIDTQIVVLLTQNVALLTQNVALLPRSSLMWRGSR